MTLLEKTNPETAVVVDEVMMGLDDLTDSELVDGDKLKQHTAISVDMTTKTSSTSIVIPNVNDVSTGGSEIFMTAPMVISLDALNDFLLSKEIELPEAIQKLLEKTDVSCDALWYRNDKKKTDGSIEKAGGYFLKFKIACKDTGLLAALLDDGTAPIKVKSSAELAEGGSVLTLENIEGIKSGWSLVTDKPDADTEQLTFRIKSVAGNKVTLRAAATVELPGATTFKAIEPSIGSFFDITSASVATLKCDTESYKEIYEYVEKIAGAKLAAKNSLAKSGDGS